MRRALRRGELLVRQDKVLISQLAKKYKHFTVVVKLDGLGKVNPFLFFYKDGFDIDRVLSWWLWAHLDTSIPLRTVLSDRIDLKSTYWRFEEQVYEEGDQLDTLTLYLHLAVDTETMSLFTERQNQSTKYLTKGLINDIYQVLSGFHRHVKDVNGVVNPKMVTRTNRFFGHKGYYIKWLPENQIRFHYRLTKKQPHYPDTLIDLLFNLAHRYHYVYVKV